jgi:preprotein translocase subunit SecD
MKKTTFLALASLLASAAMAFAASPVFQMRLVLDAPTGDTEPMTYVTQNGDNTFTNVLNVQKTVLLDQTALKSSKFHMDRMEQPIIEITFTDAGAKQFAEVTQQNIHKRLAFVIFGRLWDAPIIEMPISGGKVMITGNFSKQKAGDLVKRINAAIAEK